MKHKGIHLSLLMLFSYASAWIPQPPRTRNNPTLLFLAQPLNGIDRVFCLIDLHTDHAENQDWLRTQVQQSSLSKQTDLVVVAGDISHDMDTFQESLDILLSKAQVLFVPGNHEAWIDRRNQPNATSHQKLDQVYRVCQELGVITDSVLVQNNPNHCPHPLTIIPLQSWYDGTLSFNEELCHDFGTWPWADFKRCLWENPDFLPQDATTNPLPVGLADYFLLQNKAQLESIAQDNTTAKAGSIMTVSHFLPHPKCLPDWKDLDSNEFRLEWLDHGAGGMSAKFAKVAGTKWLDQQIRTLPPSNRHIHVFGHSHRPKDFELNGIRYIHNPLGKPRERKLHQVSPQVDFQLVWTTSEGEVPGEQVLRYWEEKGGGLEALKRRMKEVKPNGRYHRSPSNK